MTNPPAPEAMLKEIIERQVKGGCKTFEDLGKTITEVANVNEFIGIVHSAHGLFQRNASITEILLDPTGVRACYGDNLPCSICELYDRHPERTDEGHGCISGTWRTAAMEILNTWLSTSDPKATIETAYKLLP